MKKVYLIVGESGSGKDSLTSRICHELNFNQLMSYTTRPRRNEEGDTHIFIDKEDVEKYKGDIIAYTKIGDYEYFATKQQLTENNIYIIDPKGVDYLKKQQIDDIEFVVIYIYVREFERMRRALLRGDNKDVVLDRFLAESDQFKQFRAKTGFHYMIPNDNFATAFWVLRSIILAEEMANAEN
jgi:guanylate kinase